MSTTTSNSESSTHLTPLGRDEARSLVDQILDDAPASGFSARSALDSHPELGQFPSCVIDLAYEEYCRARENGNPIAASEFVEAFSEIQQSLYRVIEFDQVLHDHPSLVEEVPEERWPRVGDEFQGLQLLEQLGRGALSRVFLARHTKLGQKPVVVKVCIRGEREAELLGQLAHPNIGEVHSIDIDPVTGLAAICMPYQTRLTMHHLAEWLYQQRAQRKLRPQILAAEIHDHVDEVSQCEGIEQTAASIRAPFSARDPIDQLVAKWGEQLAAALNVAHANEVLHCDVKPGNVLVLPDLSVRLLDFNLATSEADRSRLAGGTLPYMSPEQLRGIIAADTKFDADSLPFDELDGRTDVYGLCATLWHMALGRPPFGSILDAPTRRRSAERMLLRLEAGIDETDRRAAEKILPRGIVDILVKGMSFDSDERHAAAAELQQAFAEQIRKDRRPVYLAVLLVAVVSLVFAVLIPRYRDPTGDAFRLAAQQLADGETELAEETIDPYRFANDQTQVLELAIRTSRLPTPTHRLHSIGPEQPILDQWQSVLDEWRNLERRSIYPEICKYNAYLVQMEYFNPGVTTLDLMRAAFGQLNSDVTPSERQLLLLEVLERQSRDEFGNVAELSQLTDTISEGTRGEFLGVFEAVRCEWNQKPSEELSDLADRLLLNLSSDKPLAEEAAARVWTIRRNKPESDLNDLAKRLRGMDNSHNFNSLARFLRIPNETEDQK